MTTITKENLTILSISLIIAIVVFICTYNKNPPELQYKVFQTESGWGYDILSVRSVIIHQVEIPVLSLKKGFETKNQAAAVAEIVIKKLKTGRPPTIGIFELSTILPEKYNSK